MRFDPLSQGAGFKRHGTCVVLMAVEPSSGVRFAQVTEQKTKKDYAAFMLNVAQHYPDAEKIVLVQDNLNTHTPSSFYEVLPAEEAFALAQRFEMVYTPKKASWLNRAEIELSALSKQCLDRRISRMNILTREVAVWSNSRNRKQTKISWQFTKNDARKKLNSAYTIVRKLM